MRTVGILTMLLCSLSASAGERIHIQGNRRPAPTTTEPLRPSLKPFIVLVKDFDRYRKAQPDFDLAGRFEQSLACFQVPDPSVQCRQVLTPSTEAATAANILEGAEEVGAMAALVEMSVSRRALKIRIRFHETTPHVVRPGKAYGFFFEASAPTEPEGDAPARSLERRSSAEEYWFAGSPSRFETTVDQSIQEFVAATGLLYGHLAPEGADVRDLPWWKDLPQLSELKQAGTIKCMLALCKRPYLRIEDGRIWLLDETSNGEPWMHSMELRSLQ